MQTSYFPRHTVSPLITATDALTGNTIDDETADLPPLTGSDKQIAWAGKIRRAAIGYLAGTVTGNRTRGINSGLTGTDVDEQMAPVYDALRRVADQADARWWIDNRDADRHALLAAEVEK